MLGCKACVNPLQLLNRFASTWVNNMLTTPLTVKAQLVCSIPSLSAQFELSVLPRSETKDAILLRQEEQSDAWLRYLEQIAQSNWKQLF